MTSADPAGPGARPRGMLRGAMPEPSSREPAPKQALGPGWLLLTLPLLVGAVLLWTGLAASPLLELAARHGRAVGWGWFGLLAAALFVLPWAFPSRGGSRLRALQLGLTTVSALAAAGGAALAREASLPTMRTGVYAGFELLDPKPLQGTGEAGRPGTADPSAEPAPAAAVTPGVSPSPVAGEPAELRRGLAALLAGEAFQLEKIPAVPPGYAEAMTRASAARTARVLLERHDIYSELVHAVAPEGSRERVAEDEAQRRVDALRARLDSLEGRAALNEVLALQAEVTGRLLTRSNDDAAARARAAIEAAEREAASARCEPKGAVWHCVHGRMIVVFEREDGAWRLNRPPVNEGLIPTPLDSELLPVRTGPTGADPNGSDQARALATVEAVMRLAQEVELSLPVDPASAELLTDEGALHFWDAQGFVMTLQLAQLARAGLLTEAQVQAFTRARVAQQPKVGCAPRETWRATLEAWNDFVKRHPLAAEEQPRLREVAKTLTQQLTNSWSLQADGPDAFKALERKVDGSLKPTSIRIVRESGRWRWSQQPIERAYLKCAAPR